VTLPRQRVRISLPYDISQQGTWNPAHEGKQYGPELAPADKDALVEYMKTF